MSKNKKFEVIEKSRFLSSDEQTNIIGGACILVKYTSCKERHDVIPCVKTHTVYCGPANAVYYRSCNIFVKQTCGTYAIEYPPVKPEHPEI